MKIAVLTGDNREPFKDYVAKAPYFGTAPEALLQGFAGCRKLEVHVVSCTQKPMKSPEKLSAEHLVSQPATFPRWGGCGPLTRGASGRRGGN